jgi:hypothetical protein
MAARGRRDDGIARFGAGTGARAIWCKLSPKAVYTSGPVRRGSSGITALVAVREALSKCAKRRLTVDFSLTLAQIYGDLDTIFQLFWLVLLGVVLGFFGERLQC